MKVLLKDFPLTRCLPFHILWQPAGFVASQQECERYFNECQRVLRPNETMELTTDGETATKTVTLAEKMK